MDKEYKENDKNNKKKKILMLDESAFLLNTLLSLTTCVNTKTESISYYHIGIEPC